MHAFDAWTVELKRVLTILALFQVLILIQTTDNVFNYSCTDSLNNSLKQEFFFVLFLHINSERKEIVRKSVWKREESREQYCTCIFNLSIERLITRFV